MSALARWAGAQEPRKGHWVTAWAASAQGPFPVGSPLALPDQSFAFPVPEKGAEDQSFRLVLRPSVWGSQARFRFTNAFGTQALAIDGAFVGLQLSAAAVVRGTNIPILFSGRRDATIPSGGEMWSDPVDLAFAGAAQQAALAGRKLAISFHVVGQSGPMTWHAKALQTSYISNPRAGARGAEHGERAFPNPTTAWFFLDAVDMRMAAPTPLIVCLGDSITDGTGSTLNGDDRWPDILQRRLHDLLPNGVAVVNAGIGGNQVAGPASYSPNRPSPGGPAAIHRIPRDVASLSGVTTVIWFEGINDLSSANNASAEAVVEGYRIGVAMLRKAIPGVRIVGATIVPALGASGNHGSEDEDSRRKAVNAAIRSPGLFDALLDFDQAARDPKTGGLKAQFVPSSTTGGPGDRLHPNRAGYLAIADSIDLAILLPGLKPRSHSR